MTHKFGKNKIKYIAFLVLSGLATFIQMPTLADQSVTFGWEPSDDPEVVGYNIYYGTASQVYTNKVSVEGATTTTISGLVEGATYYFAATTYDSLNQESAFSDEIVYSVPAATPIDPPTVVGISATNTAIVGQSIAFNVTAIGDDPINYQWTCNSNEIAGATNATLTLNSITPAQAGSYAVTVSNDAGSTNSSAANLMVYSTTAATLNAASHISGQFAFTVTGVTNYQYVVQTSTNLTDWVSVETNIVPFVFVDPNANQFGQCFYRTFCTTF
jgi:hypothetical protein